MAFNIPARNQIGFVAPTSQVSYTRPTDWISITGVPDEQIIMLVSDAASPQKRYNIDLTKSGGGNIYVDWGDSTSNTYSANTTATKTYSTGGTVCSLGYNTWKITISADTGTRITGCKLANSTDNSTTRYGLLECWFGNNTVTTTSSYFGNGVINLPLLEYVKLPEGLTDSSSFYRTFQSCASIRKIDFPISCSANTSMDGFANNAYNLMEINDLPQDMTGLTTVFQAFDGCSSLQEIKFPPTLDSCGGLNRTLQNCSNLTRCILPNSMTAATDFALAFNGCNALPSLRVPNLKTSGTLAFDNFVANCGGLKSISFPNNVSSAVTFSLSSAFNGCNSIQSIILPTAINVNTYSATFQNCYALNNCILPMNASSATTFANMFNGCVSLAKITLPTTVPTTSVSFASTFNNCRSLSEIQIPSGYTLNSLASTFTTCSSIQNIVLPNNNQDGITTMANMCQNCYNLQTITMPTSLTGCTLLSFVFNNARSLSEVTFPTNMNQCTSMNSSFSGCYSLEKVTLPTNMTSMLTTANGFTSTFEGCLKLLECTLPALGTPSGTGNYSSCFKDCYSIRTINFPSANTTATTNLNETLRNCYSLTGVTNLDQIGNQSTATTAYVSATAFSTGSFELLSLDFKCKLSKLEVQGTGTGSSLSKLNSLRLRNSGSGQYGGTSPQINISNTDLSQAAIVQVFNDLPTVTSKTINITSATGAAALTAGERAIATGKGWTITG